MRHVKLFSLSFSSHAYAGNDLEVTRYVGAEGPTDVFRIKGDPDCNPQYAALPATAPVNVSTKVFQCQVYDMVVPWTGERVLVSMDPELHEILRFPFKEEVERLSVRCANLKADKAALDERVRGLMLTQARFGMMPLWRRLWLAFRGVVQ